MEGSSAPVTLAPSSAPLTLAPSMPKWIYKILANTLVITSLSNAALDNYVDPYYSVDKFRVAYAQLIPAMPDKTQWPKATHGFFMYPPLLKPTSGRRRNQRFKGCTDKNKKKRQHKCPICLEVGHHWHTCKKGNPEDKKALAALR